jgi:hypothetical protein
MKKTFPHKEQLGVPRFPGEEDCANALHNGTYDSDPGALLPRVSTGLYDRIGPGVAPHNFPPPRISTVQMRIANPDMSTFKFRTFTRRSHFFDDDFPISQVDPFLPFAPETLFWRLGTLTFLEQREGSLPYLSTPEPRSSFRFSEFYQF